MSEIKKSFDFKEKLLFTPLALNSIRKSQNKSINKDSNNIKGNYNIGITGALPQLSISESTP